MMTSTNSKDDETTEDGDVVAVREMTHRDIPSLERLYRVAFPNEDLLPLLHNLVHNIESVDSDDSYYCCSLVVVVVVAAGVVDNNDEDIIGSIFFTACGIHQQNGTSDTSKSGTNNNSNNNNTDDDNAGIALLGPLCVSPSRQGLGYGSLLIREGIQRMRNVGMKHIVVLGDPNYYSKFGFQSNGCIEPPYPLPETYTTAWQLLNLVVDVEDTNDDVGSSICGTLIVPKPWQDKNLWG